MCIRPPSAWIGELADRPGGGVHLHAERPRSRSASPARREPAAPIDAGSSNRQASARSSSLARLARPASVCEIEHQRALGGVEELEQRASAVRQERRRATHRIAAGRLDLEHVGAEIGGDLGGERRRQPQAERHAGVVHLDDGEARERQGVGVGHRAMIGASRGFGQRHVRATVESHGGFDGTDRQSQGAAVRHLPRTVPPGRREPDARHGARHGADRVARRAGLRRGLDRRASFRRLGDHRLAGSVHRRRHRAHALHPARLGRDQPAVSSSADGGEPLRAARPHVARPHHAGLRPGRAAVRRLHDGHRALDAARRAWRRRSPPSCSC